MKMYEIRDQSQEELKSRLADAREELYNLRFQHAMHQLENPLRLRFVRRDIARLTTVLREYEIGLRTQETSTESEAE